MTESRTGQALCTVCRTACGQCGCRLGGCYTEAWWAEQFAEPEYPIVLTVPQRPLDFDGRLVMDPAIRRAVTELERQADEGRQHVYLDLDDPSYATIDGIVDLVKLVAAIRSSE